MVFDLDSKIEINQKPIIFCLGEHDVSDRYITVENLCRQQGLMPYKVNSISSTLIPEVLISDSSNESGDC